MVTKTFRGYEISKRRKGSKWKLYVKSIYGGEVTWTLDYTYAKHYTERTARKIDAEIDEAIKSGKFADKSILADR